jgi:hypothetical protein
MAMLLTASPARAITHLVKAGDNLQTVLNAAKPGDEIVLQAGAKFVGQFELPVKVAGPVIVVRSSASLPNRRIRPDDAHLMPTLVSSNVQSALSGIGTSNWKLDGIRFEPNVAGQDNLITLFNATNITIDRMLFVAPEDIGQRRGIAGNGRNITLTRSHIAGVWAQTLQDSQAFCAWDGAGPYTITHNYLEAASENVMFGGANSTSADRIPSDILVEGNHMAKRLEWKGRTRAVKNLFELKSARRVVIRGNLFENNWTDAQSGWAILFTTRNDEGGAPWSRIEDVLFEKNIVRETQNGINILGIDSFQQSGRTTRVTIRNNLIITTGTGMIIGSEIGTLVVEHNTFRNGGAVLFAYNGGVWPAIEALPKFRDAKFAVADLIFRNNLAHHYILGDTVGFGKIMLDTYATKWIFTSNVIANLQNSGASAYPVGNYFPSLADYEAQFKADGSLTGTSMYRRLGTDGLDLGANWSELPRLPLGTPATPQNLRIRTVAQ